MQLRWLPMLFLAACSDNAAPASAGDPDSLPALADAEQQSPRRPIALEKSWVADGFSNPEGAARAPNGSYFISNVAGEGAEKDGAGWISKLSVDGEIISARWADGLDAPKGMAVHDGMLFVADIDQVRLYDVETGTPQGIVPIDNAGFLNDATVWNGDVYVSDSSGAKIYALGQNAGAWSFSIWREGEELRGVNGLLGVGDRLLISTMTSGSLFEATTDNEWTIIATGMIDADGVGVVPDKMGGGYLVSSWPGEIFHVDDQGVTTSLVNTRGTDSTQNDLSIFDDAVIVPNWRSDTVTAWRIVTP